MANLQKEIGEILVDCYGEEKVMFWEVAFWDGVAESDDPGRQVVFHTDKINKGLISIEEINF